VAGKHILDPFIAFPFFAQVAHACQKEQSTRVAKSKSRISEPEGVIFQSPGSLLTVLMPQGLAESVVKDEQNYPFPCGETTGRGSTRLAP